MNENFDFKPGMTGVTRAGADFRVIGIADVENTDGETLVVEVDGELALYFADGGYFNYGDRSEHSLRVPTRTVYVIEGVQEGEKTEYLAESCPQCAQAMLEMAQSLAAEANESGSTPMTFTMYAVELPRE